MPTTLTTRILTTAFAPFLGTVLGALATVLVPFRGRFETGYFLIYLIVGTPIAYVGFVVIGLPVLWIARKLGIARFSPCMLISILVGLVCVEAFGLLAKASFEPSATNLVFGCVCSAVVGIVCRKNFILPQDNAF